MHLLFITNVYPNPLEPGRGVFNKHLVRALGREHQVRVVAPIPWVEEYHRRKTNPSSLPASRSTTDEGIPAYHPRYYYTPKVLRGLYGWFYWQSVRRTVLRLLREQKPDAVLSYWAHPDGEVAVRVARRAGVPAVLMVGGTDVLVLTSEPGRRRRVVRALRAADAVVAVSRDIKARLAALGVEPGKVHVVPRGVDASAFSPGDRAGARERLGLPAGEKTLLWVGRMVPVKGLDVLLRACARLRERGVHFRLHLVGTGPLEQELKSSSESLGLDDLVRFHGPCAHHLLPDWYRAADWTVLPSRSEGIPNVLRESLACGTPFVASAVGGIPELARPGRDRLVHPGDPDSLADALAEALAGPRPPGEPAPSLPTWQDSADSLVRIIRELPPPGRAGGRPSSVRQWLRRALSALLPARVFLTRGPAGDNAVALTFDDGPHPEHTPPLLDALRAHGVRATFFLVGEQAERHPDLVKRIAEEGHAVGNHTYLNHQGAPAAKSFREWTDEVGRTDRLLGEVLGRPARLFRPAYGKLSARRLWWLWRAGYTTALWNVDPKDYDRAAAEEVRAWFAGHPLTPGDIVLMHDNRPHAAAVLPDLVAAARARGLRFVPLSEWVPAAAPTTPQGS